MRIGCLQFSPQVGDIENNLNRADAVLSKANPDDLDLLVLPELAFSGYNFKSLQDIAPFLEPSGSGITSLWARTMALKYNCIVTVGYPEKVDVSLKWPTGPEYYSSAIVVNEDGETIANYRKRFLYQTDESWALEGNQGFYEGFIPGLGNTSIGICMDLNPYKFEAPWHAFEFAFHILEMESNLVILSMAWMTRDERRRFTRMPNEPDMDTLSYWVTRLEPLIRSDNEEEIIVVFCNRTGVEDDATYAGTSAVVGIKDGEVNVYGLLGRGQKELLLVDTNQQPQAKLVYRPPDTKTHTEVRSFTRSENVSDHSSTVAGNKDDQGASPHRIYDSSQHTKHSLRAAPSPSANQQTARAQPSNNTKTESPSNNAISHPVDPSSYASNIQRPLPTPSAPSPTPMAMRPKLIIPDSNQTWASNSASEQPLSASSVRSERSTLSCKSMGSETSIQTIRSNPRPPEDSTPYPHSSAPPSGYPASSWDAEKRIYSGKVTISQLDALSPATPLQGSSPVSSRGFAGWSDRKQQAFIWPTVEEVLGTGKGSVSEDSSTQSASIIRPFRSHQPVPATHANLSRRSVEPSAKDAARSKTVPRDDSRSSRSSPPKSRNRTHSRASRRPDSVTGQRESVAWTLAEAENDLARARSAPRSSNQDAWPVVDRPSSPKSRNCSRPRPNESRDAQSPEAHSIPIVASPSIFRGVTSTPEAERFYHSQPRIDQQYHHYSPLPGLSDKQSDDSSGAEAKIAHMQRPASRGRARKANDHDPVGLERASSKDSIINSRLHTRVSMRDSTSRSNGRLSQGSRRSSKSSIHQPDLAQFERIEVVSCSQCPVHGQSPEPDLSSAAGQSGPTNGTRVSLNVNTGMSRGQEPSQAEDTTPTLCQHHATSSAAGSLPTSSAAARADQTGSEAENASTRTAQERLQISSQNIEGTAAHFDPPTPKAMAFEGLVNSSKQTQSTS